MRLILAGNVPDVASEGLEVSRVPDAARALAGLRDEVVVVALSVASVADASALPAQSAMVLALATVESEEIRATALRAGARDVLFPPHDGARLLAAIDALLGRPPRRDPRVNVESNATLDGHDVRIKNVSRGGFFAESASALPRGAVVRLTAGDLSLSGAWARVLASELRGATHAVHARFLALTSAEQRSLDAYLQRHS